MPTAIVIGATGLVGSALMQQLVADDRFTSIKVFTRRSLNLSHSKIAEHVIDFDKPDQWRQQVTGDVLFSTLGTTLKTAGSQQAQYKIDYSYQFTVAEAAKQNGVATYVLISSAGAHAQSMLFYSRMKGALEEAVKDLSFAHTHIIRPGILAGNRQEKRTGEKIGIKLMNVLHKIPGLQGYKPVPAETVARAMINVSFNKEVLTTHSLGAVFNLADETLIEGKSMGF